MSNAYQYQSFDDAPGLVDSFAKLRAMRLPPLVGKSFFDIGCNEGYYCGVALRAGASRVVGLDSYSLAIERARVRFPKADFLLRTWEDLPEEQFDSVMFASAMHYLDSDNKMIEVLSRIRRCVKSDGILILEAGISTAPGRELVKVDRGDGSVYYPTWEKLVYIVNRAGFVWRKVGDSEPGDNYPRVVLHCRNIRPVVMFVRGRSMSGKSHLANSIVNYDYWRVLNLDRALGDIFREQFPDFPADSCDWPGTLRRAVEKLTEQEFGLISSLLVREIIQRSENVAAHNVPRQDPIVIDGFDRTNIEYEMLFNQILKELLALRFRIWDATLLSPAIEDVWSSTNEFVDCGGFLLPIGSDAIAGAITSTEIQNDVVECQAEITSNKQHIIGIAAIMAKSGPVSSIELPEPLASGRFNFQIPFNRLFVSQNNTAAQLESIDLHFIVWTEKFEAYWLERRRDSNWAFFNPTADKNQFPLETETL